MLDRLRFFCENYAFHKYYKYEKINIATDAKNIHVCISIYDK